MRQLGLFELEPVEDDDKNEPVAKQPETQPVAPAEAAVNIEVIPEEILTQVEEETLIELPAEFILPNELPVAELVEDEPAGTHLLKAKTNKAEGLATKGKRGRKSYKDISAESDLIEVPEDEELMKKSYYPIGEVAEWFKVNFSLLRYWETEFTMLKPRKNKKGDRFYSPQDVKNLQLIYHLLRQRKFSIDGAKDYIKNNKKKVETELQLVQSLNKFRSFLLEIRSNLD